MFVEILSFPDVWVESCPVDLTTDKTTHQLCDVGHLSHVVHVVFSRLVQHDEAGGHGAQVPERLHLRLDAAVAVCWSECHGGKLDCNVLYV